MNWSVSPDAMVRFLTSNVGEKLATMSEEEAKRTSELASKFPDACQCPLCSVPVSAHRAVLMQQPDGSSLNVQVSERLYQKIIGVGK